MTNEPKPNDPVTHAEFDEAMHMIKTSFDHVATKEELANLKDDLASVKKDVVGVKEDLVGVKGEVTGIKDTVETVLAIVQSLDADRKEQRSMRDLPKRVGHLEEDVLKIKSKVYSRGN